MDLALFKLFVTGRERRSIAGLLLLQSVFLGIYYGIFNILAHAIFLSRFDETHMARTYVLSGLVGIGLTSLYSIYRSRLRFSFFSVINLVFIFLVTLFLWILLSIGPVDLVVYSIFIMLGPLFILAMLSYRDTVRRLLSTEDDRKLSGIIDAGPIVGMIISSFSVPVLLSFNIATHSIFIISAVSIVFAVYLQQLLIKRYRVRLDEKQHLHQVRIKKNVLRNNRYLRSLYTFVFLSVLVLFFIQYLFMAVTRDRYPGEIEMASFLGLFEGGMMLFALLIHTFLFIYLIKSQGLRITLAISPVLIGLITLVALITGLTGGFMPGASGFMMFFLILALSRLFSRSLDISVEKPAFRILSRPLAPRIRDNVQFALNGSVNEIGVLTSGLILTGLGALTFVTLIHFSWVLIVIVVLWLIVALQLYKEYRHSVRKTLESSASKSEDETEAKKSERFDSISSSGLFIDNNYFELITSTELHENISSNRLFLHQVLNKAEQSLNPNILPLLKNLKSAGVDNNGIASRLISVVRNIESGLEKAGLGKRKELIATLEESHNRKLQLQAIMSQQAPPVVTDLMRFIRDQDIEVIRETINIAGKFRVKELSPEICECLDNSYLAANAYSVLRSFGEDAFSALAGHFYRSTGNIMMRRLILRLFAETGGAKAIEYLLPRMWSVNRLLKKEAVKGLSRCGYKANDENRKKLYQEIKDVIGLIAWNLSACITLRNHSDSLLCEAIEDETHWWSELLFDMLSLIYERSSLEQIKENLGKGTMESINFALEMLDILVDDDIKPQLAAYFNDMLPGQKVKNLFQFYPGTIPGYKSLVQELVNKDYNHIGVWAKACAVRSLYGLPKPEETDFLVALLFGVHRILREEACRFLQDNYDDVYSSCSYRLPKIYRGQLDDLLGNHIRDKELIYNKVESLSKIFPAISRNKLIKMAEDLVLINEEQVASLEPGSDFIIWSVNYGNNHKGDEMYFKWQTAGQTFDIDKIWNKAGDYYLLYIDTIEQFVFYNPDSSPQMVRYMDNIIEENSPK
ncbi:MAG: MFS transporter [Bacteroidota bacterium]|nr:MFS transporter [Bacteroidota bacterium]